MAATHDETARQLAPRRSATRWAAVLLVSWLLPAAACLGTAEPTPEEIAKAVKELGDGAFQVREQASAFLWKVGRAAEPAVREAVKSTDPEVARRARALFDKFQWGIYADTPKDVVELIERYRDGSSQVRNQVVEQLSGKGRSGDEALVKLFLAATDSETRNLFLRQDLSGTPVIVNRLLVRGDLALAEQVLEAAALGDRLCAIADFAVFLQLRNRLDEKITKFKAKATSRPEDMRILAYLYWAKGDLRQARQAAEKAMDSRVLAAIFYELSEWKELSLHHRPKAGVHVSDALEELGYLAAYQRLSGDAKGFAETAAKIRQCVTDGTGTDGKTREKGDDWYWTKALLINELLPVVFELLHKSDHTNIAFELLRAQSRYREAFALGATAKVQKRRLWPGLEIGRAKALNELGETEQCRQLLAQLNTELLDLKSDDVHSYPLLIQAEYHLGLKEQAFAHCTAFLAKADEKDNRVGALWNVFPEDGDTPQTWWWFFRQKFPREDHVATMKRVREIMEGKAAPKDLACWALEVKHAARRLRPQEYTVRLEAIAKTCLAAGLETDAKDLADKANSGSDSPWPLLRIADCLLQKKRWEEAAEYYRRAGEKAREVPASLYLRGWCLLQAREEKEGRRLMEIASLLPLADEFSRFHLADRLKKHGLRQEARREVRLIRDGDFRLDSNALELAAEEAVASRDYFQAAACYQRLLLRAIPTSTAFSEYKSYLLVPCWIHSNRARGFLAAGNVAEALREADLALALLPGETEVPIHLVPGLDKFGRHKEAEELFTKVYRVHEQVCANYPRAAAHHNWMAWLSARCGRRLDEALAHADRAVALVPENAAYRDTLAEVHFQRGDKEKAVALMKRCLEHSPQRAYFRAQLRRFEAGDPTAPVPPEETDGN